MQARLTQNPGPAPGFLHLGNDRFWRYALKTPCRNGTSHIVLEPLDLMARLAALVPPRHATVVAARICWSSQDLVDTG